MEGAAAVNSTAFSRIRTCPHVRSHILIAPRRTNSAQLYRPWRAIHGRHQFASNPQDIEVLCGGSSGGFALGIAFSPVFALYARRRRCAAKSNHDRDDVDIDLEQIEVARHLAQFLTLAGNLLRDVDSHVALGDPARAADEHFGLD